MNKHALNCLGALVLGLGVASGAHANWTFTGTGTISDSNATGITVSTSGAYAANGGTYTTTCNNKTISGTGYSACGGSGFASGAKWTVGASSNLTAYSGGLGMSSDSLGSTAPNHALDNGPSTTLDGNSFVNGVGNTESILLSFSSSIVLKSIGLGYIANDADISLFRYTGSGAPTINGTGATLAQMTTAGWSLVGNYGDLAQDTSSPYNSVNASGLASSYWLISAYNNNYGAATSGSVNQGNDYFKVYAVDGTAAPGGKTPEPASFALVGVALAGAGIARRRGRRA